MAKKRLDYFAFYPDDFSADGKVEAMSTKAVGAYILLLCKAWRENPSATLPDSDPTLARWARVSLDDWMEMKAEVTSAFTFCEGRWFQKRLRCEFDKVRKLCKTRSQAGLKGALASWQTHSKRTAKPSHARLSLREVGSESLSLSQNPNVPQEHIPPIVPEEQRSPAELPQPKNMLFDQGPTVQQQEKLRKAEAKQQEKAEKKRLEQQAATAAAERIEELYSLYPKKTDPRNARLAIHRALKRATFDDIKAGLLKYAELRRGEDPQYTKGTAAWFNGDGWASDMVKYPRTPSGRMPRLSTPEDIPPEKPDAGPDFQIPF